MSAQSTKTTTTKSTPTERKVPLHQVQAQLQIIEELLNQLEVLAIAEPGEDLDLSEAEAAQLIEQKQQALALELQQLQQENQLLYDQAINRILNRAAFETRQWVGQEAVAKYYRTQASVLGQEIDRSKRRIRSIKRTIASSLQFRGETRFKTVQHLDYLQVTAPLNRQEALRTKRMLLTVEFDQVVLQSMGTEGGREMTETLDADTRHQGTIPLSLAPLLAAFRGIESEQVEIQLDSQISNPTKGQVADQEHEFRLLLTFIDTPL
jgi:hypothetical protein